MFLFKFVFLSPCIRHWLLYTHINTNKRNKYILQEMLSSYNIITHRRRRRRRCQPSTHLGRICRALATHSLYSYSQYRSQVFRSVIEWINCHFVEFIHILYYDVMWWWWCVYVCMFLDGKGTRKCCITFDNSSSFACVCVQDDDITCGKPPPPPRRLVLFYLPFVVSRIYDEQSIHHTPCFLAFLKIGV